MVPPYKRHPCPFYEHLIIINALRHGVPLLFWGVLLLQRASYLLNFIIFMLSVNLLCYNTWSHTISGYLALQNWRIMSTESIFPYLLVPHFKKPNSIHILNSAIFAGKVFKQQTQPLGDRNCPCCRPQNGLQKASRMSKVVFFLFPN